MLWNKQDLQNLLNEYNKKYFNDEIKYPINLKLSRTYYNDDRYWGSAFFNKNNVHIIKLNVNMLNADIELLKCILIHEMIHCLQDEIDNTWEKTYAKDKGHNKFFLKKCKELNNKYNFKFPLQRYVSQEQEDSLKELDNSMYYVYTNLYYNEFMPNIPYGFFIKHLYDVEIQMLKRKGWKIKFFEKVIEKKNSETVSLNGKNTIKYNQLKNINPKSEDDISDQATVNNIDDFLYSGRWFNFEEGKQLVESKILNKAINLLESVGYTII